MSSQGAGSIPFTYTPNNDGYRLLELPSELAAMLDSPNAPTNLTHDRLSYSDDQERDVSASPQKQGITAFATIHESIELIRQASDKPPDKAAAKPAVSVGKWHERFGKTR
ncbi:hypothetical protein Cpir12675_000661 [Ceratocystis pirilliformis]|uniref:Uncharacterized protein n=1 Tax=Ceratocystis pirilliformis TaxID=259994 RepID=A0ABR3ZKI3_9PEZI